MCKLLVDLFQHNLQFAWLYTDIQKKQKNKVNIILIHGLKLKINKVDKMTSTNDKNNDSYFHFGPYLLYRKPNGTMKTQTTASK